MTLLAAIFRFEWYRLVRSRLLLSCLIAFVLISGLAIHTGYRSVSTRLVQVDSLQKAYQRDFAVQWQQITDTTEAGKKKAKNTGLAAVVNFRLPQHAIWAPQPLQTLSIGISDIQPFYHQVQKSVSYLDPPNIPVSNPVRLFAGNFDLSFIWIYILPLLIIAYCYPLYNEEKEAGTAALLIVQGTSLRRILAYKLFFRVLLISVLVLALNIVGILSVPGSLSTEAQAAGWWCWTTQLYILLWASLVWFAVSLRYNSPLTALLLIGCWLAAVMIGPAVTNIYVAARYPLPLRSELASIQRHESEEIWSMNPRMLVDSFNIAHPQYNGSSNPAKDTLFLSNRFVAAYYDLLDRRIIKEVRNIDQQVDQRNQQFRQVAWLNPTLQTQQLFNELAGTSRHDFVVYRNEVYRFQKEWQAFLYPWLLTDRSMGPEQFRQFPVFTLHRKAISTSSLLKESLLHYLLILVLATAGSLLLRRNSG